MWIISASKQLAWLNKDVLRVVNPHKLYKDLIVVVDLPRPTAVHHQETILHIDESCRTAEWSSTVDGPVSLVWFTGSFTFQPVSAHLHSSPFICQSGLTTRTVDTDLFEVLSFTKIWLYHQKFSLLDKTTFNLNILFSSPSSLVDAMTSLINIAYDQCWLAKHLSRPPRKLLYTVFRKTCDHVFYVRLQRFLAQLLLGHWQVFF